MLHLSCRTSSSISRKLVLVAVVLVTEQTAFADHVVSITTPNTIPSFCQERDDWCGEAVMQMILQGYPNAEHTYSQAQIETQLNFNRGDRVAWSTDPEGLKKTLMVLGGDPGVNWEVDPKTTAEALMYDIAFWMTKLRFPVAALVDNGNNGSGAPSSYGSFAHWTVITGISTDMDPTTNNTNVSLLEVNIIDPLPKCTTNEVHGVPSTITGSAWYNYFQDVAGILPGSDWNGKFVAVIEPPKQGGSAKAKTPPQTGTIVSEAVAAKSAIAALPRFANKKNSPYAILLGTTAFEPLLVNQEKKGYYIVPFGDSIKKISFGAILVNAYTGEFEQISVFPTPIQYVGRDRAIALALQKLCGCKDNEAIAQLIHWASAQAQSRLLPIWKVTSKKKIIYVTQQEKIYTELTKLSRPGD